MRTPRSLPAPITAIAVTHSGPSCPVLRLPRPVPLILLTEFPVPLIYPPPFPLTRNDSSGDRNHAPGISQRTIHNSGGHPVTPGAPLALTSPAASSTPSARHASTAASRRAAAEPGKDRSTAWLRIAAAGLCALAAAAAAVSFTAQYQLADATRHLPVIAALEAAIPDAAALVFACLGVALALHGRRAIRARTLNLAAVGTITLTS
jgi:hypothetical protein